MQLMELLRRYRTVVVPPDDVLGHRVLDDELVLRRGAGVDAGVRDERPPVGELGLARRDRMFVEARRRDVPMHGLQAFQAEFVGAVRAVPHTAFLHGRPSDKFGLEGLEAVHWKDRKSTRLNSSHSQISYAVF